MGVSLCILSYEMGNLEISYWIVTEMAGAGASAILIFVYFVGVAPTFIRYLLSCIW